MTKMSNPGISTSDEGGNDILWSFSQIKGAVDSEEISEGNRSLSILCSWSF